MVVVSLLCTRKVRGLPLPLLLLLLLVAVVGAHQPPSSLHSSYPV